MASLARPTARLARLPLARTLTPLASTSLPLRRSLITDPVPLAEPENEYSNAHLAGMGAQPFSKEAQAILTAPIEEDLVELRPGGLFSHALLAGGRLAEKDHAHRWTSLHAGFLLSTNAQSSIRTWRMGSNAE